MRLIDADALIALVQDSTILGDGFKQAFCALVNGEPTIEPERKKGKWIGTTKHHKDDQQDFYYLEVTCSECGVIRKIGWRDVKYCPNCGAELEEGES